MAGHVAVCAGPVIIADIHAGLYAQDGAANALLVAAAPDLFAVLVDILNEIIATEGATRVSRYSRNRARAAIAKAKGRAQ